MVLVQIGWAVNIVMAKEALRGFSPLALVQLRVAGAAGIFSLVAWLRPLNRRASPRAWAPLFILALSGVALNQFFFISGIARSSVAHAGLITALGPVFVLLLSRFLGLERFSLLKLVGMVTSFSGVAALTLHRAGQGNGSSWAGDVLNVVASMAFACYVVQLKKVADQYSPLTLNTLVYGLGALMLLPFGLHPVLATRWSAISSQEVLAASYMIVIGSVVSYAIYVSAFSDLSASHVAAFNYLQPVIAIVLGVWLLSEKLTWRVLIGGALILLGVYLTQSEPTSPAPQTAAGSLQQRAMQADPEC